MKIAIAGHPRAGKTTMSKNFNDVKVLHTDDIMHKGWSEASDDVSMWFNLDGDYIIEGVAVPRALRKWIAKNKFNNKKPCDKVYYLCCKFVLKTKEQNTMAVGCDSVWNEILPELNRRKVEIETINFRKAMQGK